MKSLITMLLFSSLTAWTTPVCFYLGTYTDNPLSQGIYTGTVDAQTGALGPVTLAAPAKSPSYLAWSPDGGLIYALTAKDHGTVAAFRPAADGSLTLVKELPTDSLACHVSVDATGHGVFLAAYGSGTVVGFATRADGALDQRTAFFQATGHGPHPQRQTQPHVHSTYPGPENRQLYACDLGTDKIWIFDLNPATAALTPAQPAFATVPPGSGPRHLAWSRDGRFAYVNGEMGMNVTVFFRDPATGALTARQTISTLPPGHATTNGLTNAEIMMHPTGRWLYVSNRGCDTITMFAVGDDGLLTWHQTAPAQVKMPRGFGLDPAGHWLVVGGQADHRLAVLKIDSDTGRLTTTGQAATVGAPVCVLFQPPGH